MRLTREHRPPLRAAAGETLIEARGVSIDLGGDPILRDVDLVARAGELVALVGPNGSGKTTLLSILCGDLTPDAGSVLVGDAALSSWSDREMAMRRAVLPQQVAVTFPFLVEDVVRMGRSPWLGSAAEVDDDREVYDAMARTDVEELAGRRFPSLSGGERARAALARVLAQRTQLILLDEPTAALDVHHQELVLRVVRERASEGCGVIVVLHDLGLAGAYADRIAILEHGRVAADGPPREVLDPELLSRVYRHTIEVIERPETGELLVIPLRGGPHPA